MGTVLNRFNYLSKVGGNCSAACMNTLSSNCNYKVFCREFLYKHQWSEVKKITTRCILGKFYYSCITFCNIKLILKKNQELHVTLSISMLMEKKLEVVFILLYNIQQKFIRQNIKLIGVFGFFFTQHYVLYFQVFVCVLFKAHPSKLKSLSN